MHLRPLASLTITLAACAAVPAESGGPESARVRAQALLDQDRPHIAHAFLMAETVEMEPGPERDRAEVLLVELGRQLDERTLLPHFLRTRIGGRLWTLPLTAEQRAWAHLAIGTELVRGGDHRAAAEHLEAVPETSAYYPAAQHRLGVSMMFPQNLDEAGARVHLERVIAAGEASNRPDVIREGHAGLARIDFNGRRYDASAERYRSILVGAPADDPVHLERAWALFHGRHLDEAWTEVEGLSLERSPEVVVLRATLRFQQCALTDAIDIAGTILDPGFARIPSEPSPRMKRLAARPERVRRELEGLVDAELIALGEQQLDQWTRLASILESDVARRDKVFFEDFVLQARIVRMESAWLLAGQERSGSPCPAVPRSADAETWLTRAAQEASRIAATSKVPTSRQHALAEVLRRAALVLPTHAEARDWITAALGAYDRALASPEAENPGEIRDARRRALMQLGDIHALNDRIAEAREAYASARKARPTPGEALYLRYALAFVEARDGDVASARHQMQAVLRDARANRHADLARAAQEALSAIKPN